MFEDQKVFEVIVKGTPETRRNVASVRNLLIDKPGGGHVRLGDVAEVRVAQTPAVIKRDAVSRYLDVEADVSGRSVGDVANDIENRLADLSLPLEYHAEVLQQTTGKEINSGRMLAFALGCAIAIFLLLQAGFGGWRLAVLAFVTVPVAFAGGMVAALIAGAELSLGSLIGFLALFGIAIAQRPAADPPLPAPRARGGGEVRPRPGAAGSAASGSRRSRRRLPASHWSRCRS